MSKTIMLLQAAMRSNPEKVKLLLKNNQFAPVTGSLLGEEHVKSAAISDIFSQATVKTLKWRFPPGEKHRKVAGVNNVMIAKMLSERGVPITTQTMYENVQIPDGCEHNPEWQGRTDYLEFIMTVSEQKYTQLCQQYGDIAVIDA